jgi:hypothetical protein
MKVIRLIGSDSGRMDAMNIVVSGIDGVHDAVVDHANQSATIARARLAQHRHSGDSKITVTEGDVDAYVNLDDTAGDMAAWAIEFGRKGGEGLYIISKATGFVR